MKFKFGFFKTASYQRFHIQPRYYDPVKEDIANRTARIKREMGIKDDEHLETGYRNQIAGSFRKNMKHTPQRVGGNATMMRLIIFIVLVLVAGGFYIDIDLSNLAYLFFLFIPYYLWKKYRR